MSSESNISTDPSTPPDYEDLPCMFTVEQFQQAAASQDADSEPSRVYIVRPTAIWESLGRFREVFFDDKTYFLNDKVCATRCDLPNFPLWIAHILEIRGHKPSNQIFLRVFWLYKPKQLPDSLRRPYHGWDELIPSNSMSVIDATVLCGLADVEHWHEDVEPQPIARPFWRQTYDVHAQELSVRVAIPPTHYNQVSRSSKKQSKKKKEITKPANPPKKPPYQACPAPCTAVQNPDKELVKCFTPGCKARMHEQCILDVMIPKLQAEFEARFEAEEAEAATAASSKKGKKGKQKAKKAKPVPSLKVKWAYALIQGYGVVVTEGDEEPVTASAGHLSAVRG
ncbi:hypothetical protein IMSHALPRED_009234 [Imshaugia aleurites]|uniref:BAH domain-containing protein n=1 Tax=Imshaugia aleurites TaxID=172621 RepID=A0A8H3I9Z3_9LECA|nr:hypothetical protein IMSHALPRED_009234 [Imshaugia aleurites]